MLNLWKLLFRHFRLPNLGALLGANVVTAIPFLAALIGPLLLSKDLGWGTVVLLLGFLVTGQVMAVSGRVLDRRFQGKKSEKGTVWGAWAQGWAEGLVMTGVLVGLFTLVFSSFPFYWSQGTTFSLFSLLTLALGTVLVLGALPFYLPVRRREGLGLAASVGRSFSLMNSHPGLALGTLGLGLVGLAANLGTVGLFPGFAGLAALHQGVYDRVTSSPERPGTEG